MRAIMLAAGEGTRCHPFTHLSPKVSQQVGGIPILEYMLSWFGSAPEIEKLYIVVASDSTVERLKNYLQKRKPYLSQIIDLFGRLGCKVEYTNPDFEIDVIRANGWGTGGDLRFAIRHITSIDKLNEDFLVCNADYVVARKVPQGGTSPQLNLSDIINYHRNCKRALHVVMTMALIEVERETTIRFGVAQLQEVKGFSLVRGFVEKPKVKDISENPLINAGVYVIDSSFVLSNLDEFLPDRPNTNLERTLLERLSREVKPRLAGYLLDLYAWFDVGTLEQLIDVNVYIASKKGIR